MPLNFPTTGLTAGVTTYTFGGNTWIWNGYAWDSVVTPDSVGLTAYVRTWNGQTGNITFSNYVTSVNGLTGAVTGIAGTGSNTFTGLQTMNAGITSNNLYVSAGATFNSNVTINGNLTVSGGITSTFSENVLIEDNFILLNSNVTGGSPSENAGIEISRGASANVQLSWNETADKWQFTNDGTLFYDMPTSVVNTINGYTGAFTLTGTANEVEITGATSFVVGLPDNVTITNLTVTNSVTASHFDGPLLGRVTARVKNDDTITLTAGMPVYISGYQGSGNSGILLVKAADSSNSSTMPALGLIEETLAVNGQGHVVELGMLGSLNTNGFSANQVVYIAPGGGLTATRPTAGTHLVQNIGRVVNASTTQGQIIVLGPGRSNDVPNRIVVRDYLEMPNGQTATSLVTTWNGASGAVTYATPLATSSVTGVASFGNEFTVSAAGAVSLTGNYVKSWNGSTGDVIFSNYVTSVNGSTGAITSIAVTGANTFTGLQTMNAGITANNLWVTNGATFAALATFSNGLSSGGNITVNQAVQVAQNAANTTALILRTRATNSNYITINATGGNVTVGSGTGVLRVTTGFGNGTSLAGTARGYLTLQGTDGESPAWDVTIDPSTALTANRTLTCPDASGTIALTNTVVSSAVAGTAITVSGATGAVTITNNGVRTFNGLTGTVTFAVPVATSSVTGVASFGNEFVVSAAGAVSLTANYVKSFNGLTGTVTYATPLATSSVTGVASFGNEFVVSAAGAVSLTANYVKSWNGSTGAVTFSNYVTSVNGATGVISSIAVIGSNTFTGLQTMNAGITSSTLFVSGGATFSGSNLVAFTTGLTAAEIRVGNQLLTSTINSTSVSTPLAINNDAGTQTRIGDFGLAGSGTYVDVDDVSPLLKLNCPLGTITIGDVGGAYNGTSIEVNDGSGSINLNGAVSANSVSSSGNLTTTADVVFGGASAFVSSQTTTLGTTAANQNIASVEIFDGSVNTNRSVEFFVQASTSTAYEALKILAIHDGTNTYNTQYGLIRTGSSLCSSYTTTITSATGGRFILRLRATPTNTNTTFKVVETVIPV